VERLSGKPVELGQLHAKGRVPGRLVDAAVSCQAGACPSRVGLQSFHMKLEPGGAWWVWSLKGRGLVIPRVVVAQQGLKGGGLGDGYPGEL
jgi:hypothetical protein